jgi:hypothetical protein
VNTWVFTNVDITQMPRESTRFSSSFVEGRVAAVKGNIHDLHLLSLELFRVEFVKNCGYTWLSAFSL